MPINKPSTFQETEEESRKKQQFLDIPPDKILNHLVALASLLLEVPIAAVLINDSGNIRVKAQYGLDNNTTSIPAETGLFDKPGSDDALIIIENTLTDERSKSHSLVTGPFHLRFYSSIPLNTSKGYHLGDFGIMDVRPRRMEEKNRKIMLAIADMINAQIEARISLIDVRKQQRKTLHALTHNLKNPLTLITLQSALIMDEKDDHEAINELCRNIKKAAERMTAIIDKMHFEDPE